MTRKDSSPSAACVGPNVSVSARSSPGRVATNSNSQSEQRVKPGRYSARQEGQNTRRFYNGSARALTATRAALFLVSVRRGRWRPRIGRDRVDSFCSWAYPVLVRLLEDYERKGCLCSRTAIHGQLIDVNLGQKEIAGLVCYVHPC